VVLVIEERESTESFLDRNRGVRSAWGGSFGDDWVVDVIVVVEEECNGNGDAEVPFASLNANPTPLPAILHRFLTT
jgi:hypothetical protein